MGEAIAQLLTERGLSLRALARATQLSPGYLSEVVGGGAGLQMPAETIDRIAEAFGVAATYFRERRQEQVFDYLRANPASLDVLWEVIRESPEARRRRPPALQARRVEAVAQVLWTAQPASADVSWQDADEERKAWLLAVATEVLKAADDADGPAFLDSLPF